MHDTENDLKNFPQAEVPVQFDNTPSNCFYVGQLFWGCVLQVRETAMADTNSQTDLIWGCHALITVNQWSTTHFTTLNNDSPINDPVKIHLIVS